MIFIDNIGKNAAFSPLFKTCSTFYNIFFSQFNKIDVCLQNHKGLYIFGLYCIYQAGMQ